MRALLPSLRRLIPDLGEVSALERLRASLGAMLGLLVTGLVSRLALGGTTDLPLLIAPMGASAVLLFAVPSSPLAQPWSILGGNMVAALIGVAAARMVGDPIAAAALGGALAIAAMMVLRCLHPPSGAVALTAVLGGPAVHAAGYGFAIWPVGLNSALLLAAALAFNNATGRRYPHAPPERGSLPGQDDAVSRVLRRHGELVDIGRSDLAELVGEIEWETTAEAEPRCGDVMRRPFVSLDAALPLDAALDRLTETGCTALPVLDAGGRYRGMLGQDALLRHLRPTRAGRSAARLFQRSLRFDVAPSTVGALVTDTGPVARPEMPIHVGLDLVIDGGRDLPVVDAAGHVVGLLTQSDLLRWTSSRLVKDASRTGGTS